MPPPAPGAVADFFPELPHAASSAAPTINLRTFPFPMRDILPSVAVAVVALASAPGSASARGDAERAEPRPRTHVAAWTAPFGDGILTAAGMPYGELGAEVMISRRIGILITAEAWRDAQPRCDAHRHEQRFFAGPTITVADEFDAQFFVAPQLYWTHTSVDAGTTGMTSDGWCGADSIAHQQGDATTWGAGFGLGVQTRVGHVYLGWGASVYAGWCRDCAGDVTISDPVGMPKLVTIAPRGSRATIDLDITILRLGFAF